MMRVVASNAVPVPKNGNKKNRLLVWPPAFCRWWMVLKCSENHILAASHCNLTEEESNVGELGRDP